MKEEEAENKDNIISLATTEQQMIRWREAYYKKELARIKRDYRMMPKEKLLDFLYHQQKQHISVDTTRYVMSFMGHGSHTGEAEKKELMDQIEKRFKLKFEDNWCMASMDVYLPFILERYLARLNKTGSNEIRIGINGVKVGKRQILTCVVITLPFLDDETHEEVI